MSQPVAVAVEGLRVVRGGRTVLHDLELQVPRGRITGLLGPSGCGKTTLMRALVGTQRITSGSVRVLGHPAGSPELRRRIGYSTQAPAVYPDLTVAENVAYFAAVRGGLDDSDRVLDLVGLTELADRLAGELSGGQLGRVSLAVALLDGCDLLVLDEPTTGLDPVLRAQLWRLFADLATQGATVLVSSHSMDEAAQCDGLVLMRAGRLLARGTPDDLLTRTGTSRMEEAFIELVQADTRGVA